MSPEEIQDLKAYAASNLSEYKDALADVNKQIPDVLVEGYGKSGNLAQVAANLSYDEIYRIAKDFEHLADALKRVERDRWEAKKAGITL